jgi:hypothetical protein
MYVSPLLPKHRISLRELGNYGGLGQFPLSLKKANEKQNKIAKKIKIANENQIKKSKNSKTYQKPNLILNLLDGLVGKYFINLKIYATVRTNVRFLHRVRVKYPYLNVG